MKNIRLTSTQVQRLHASINNHRVFNMHKLLFLITFLIWATGTSANELEDRQVIKNKVEKLFYSGDYAQLDRMATSYMTTTERTSSGLWKLTLFYAGLTTLPNQEITTYSYWDSLENRSNNWIKAYPKSPSAYLTYSAFLIAHAWMYRGTGWNYQVKKEDWAPFNQYIEKAKVVLDNNKAIASKDPEWYVLMISVATAQNWNTHDFETLLNEATTKYPYFYQIYFGAINYLTPKWHGSKEEIEDFANKAVSLTKKEEKNGMYARIYWFASQANYGNSLFTNSAVVWGKMSTSIDDIIEKYPDQWNINNFAHFSCLAGDAQKTKILMRKIKGAPILSAWNDMVTFTQCKAWSEGLPDTNLHN
jgi:hypothetical protein